jgi:ligand-binding SRPBCC domain-containing protein
MEHRLCAEAILPRPREEVFAFFSDAANLQRITPPELGFRILSPLPIAMQPGALIRYQLRLFGVPFRWRTRITRWDPHTGFVDAQESGPYELWEHSHYFEDAPGGTRMRDEVRYALPLQPLGELAHPIVGRQLDRIFGYRTDAMHEIFGVSPPSS